MEEKVRKITKNVFSQCSGEGKATIPFLRTNVISEKNTEKRETYPIYLGSDGMCTAVVNILYGGPNWDRKNLILGDCHLAVKN